MAIRDRVDQLMAQDKRLAGVGTWLPTDYDDQLRWKVPLSVVGEVTSMDLLVDAYPSAPVLTFRIAVLYGSCVSRLDYSSIDRHLNHQIANVQMPTNVSEGWMIGTHYHPWNLNNFFATEETLPKELEYAIPIPGNVQGFPNAFRWFCGEAKILVGVDEVPDYPARDRLL